MRAWLCGLAVLGGLTAVGCTASFTPPAGAEGTRAAAACREGVDPGPVYLRRLTNAEYARTVRDALGVDATAEAASFPEDLDRTGYDNSSLEQTVSALHAARYFEASGAIAARVLASPQARARALGCELAQPTCLQDFVVATGRRLYRQPLAADEVAELVALARTEPRPEDGAALALRALLNSPRFLFRVEVGRAAQGRVKLDGFEVATRLAFFLTGSTPDDALLDAAQAGELDELEGLAAHTRRLLQTPRVREALRGFMHQWFHVEDLETLTRDAARFPGFGPELKASLVAELDALFEEHLWGAGKSFMELYTTRTTTVDARLAPLYGLPPPAAPTRVTWAEPDRAGVLSTAAWLTLSSRRSETSAIHRGVLFREQIICDPPPPPMVAVSPPAPQAEESVADAEERHARDPACAGCHVLIDPIGHGLERFDALGQRRASYPSGRPVRLEGTVQGLGTPVESFAGGAELGALVASSEKGQACVVQQLFRYGFGRKERAQGADDECTLAQLGDAFVASAHSFPELVVALVSSDAFRFRRAPEP